MSLPTAPPLHDASLLKWPMASSIGSAASTFGSRTGKDLQLRSLKYSFTRRQLRASSEVSCVSPWGTV
jgi:hypothetical protein